MSETIRLIAAAGAAAAWLLLVAWTIWRHRPRRNPIAADAVLVAYASQTGTAANLARATADTLEASGRKVSLHSFARLTPAALAETTEALFVLATTGEGDPPDDATLLVKRLADKPLDLKQLRYSVLALGDSHYKHFCAFGRAFDRLLIERGAQPAADRVELDQVDAGALRHWQQNLRLFGASANLPDWEAPSYARWRLVERECLNPGSPGAPMYRIALRPEGDLPAWAAGDVAQIYPGPSNDAFSTSPPLSHRDYSTATIPADGALDLVVRQFRDAEGRLGLGSGWLCERASIGETIAVRIRSNPLFHTPPPTSPLMLIGNGAGISSLRAHLKARPKGTRNWLVFGERDPMADRPFNADLQAWLESGHLTRCDRVFSRGASLTRYVQHALLAEGDGLRAWVSQNAVILVCGSIVMGNDVDVALRQILGVDHVDAMIASGRYRRDIY